MNVLLLALSTIPSDKINCYDYQYENEEKFSGYYQLEPIPKFLNEKLKKEKQKIDYIITLNTNEVNNDKFIKISCNKEDNNQFIFENITAKGLFEELLTKGDKAITELPSIIPIDIDVDNIMPGIVDAIDKLRTLKKEKGSFDLYIDIHGGPRNTQMTFQTILSLLKHESIFPKAIYTIIVNKIVNKRKQCTIKDETKYFEYIDFVVGMNEFLDFGKPISTKGGVLSDNETLEEFTNKANDIADALSLCDMEKFKADLKNMSTWIDNNRAINSSLLRLFIGNIQSDYGKLLNNDHLVIDEIEWCLKKGYLQQAMTLIESKMPEELFNHGIFYYDKNDERIDEFKQNWEPAVNFILIKLIRSLKINPCNEKKYDFGINLYENREYYTSISFKHKKPTINKNNKLELRKKYKNSIFVDAQIKNNDENVIRLLLLHYALKEERNNTNHASSIRKYTSENIRDAIGGYVDLARKIY